MAGVFQTGRLAQLRTKILTQKTPYRQTPQSFFLNYIIAVLQSSPFTRRGYLADRNYDPRRNHKTLRGGRILDPRYRIHSNCKKLWARFSVLYPPSSAHSTLDSLQPLRATGCDDCRQVGYQSSTFASTEDATDPIGLFRDIFLPIGSSFSLKGGPN
jgi:hypothetical protein